jgi:hypothetical protein
MLKKVLIAVGVALGAWLFLTLSQPMGFAVARVVELPTELAGLLAGAVYFVVSLALQGRLPDEYIEEIAGAVTTALLSIIAVGLRLIPLEFEALATGLLNVLVIILGVVSVVKLLFAGGKRLLAR